MPATFNKFNCFVADVHNGEHDLSSDQLEVALSNTQPVATDTTANTEISYTNLSSRDITITSSTQTNGTYKLVLEDLTITATTEDIDDFQFVILRNKTTNKLIGWFDYESAITLHGLNADQFVVDFSQVNGVLTDV